MNREATVHSVKLRARSTPLLFAILTIAWVGTARAQLEQLAPYDDFTAPKISPTKWLGGEGRDSLGLEAKRGIVNGQLQLNSRSVGFTNSDTGVGTNFVYAGYPNTPPDTHASDDVNEMKAAITVSAMSVPGCAGNSTPTQAYALLAGSFFNTASPTPDDQTNDVVAAIGLHRGSDSVDPAGTVRVTYFVLQCTDKHCDTFVTLGSDDHLGNTVAIGTAAKVEIQWDKAHHQFLFSRGNQPADPVPYNVSDVEDPGLPFKNLEVFNSVANCTTLPRPIANITALFDNVMLNQSAAQ